MARITKTAAAAASAPAASKAAGKVAKIDKSAAPAAAAKPEKAPKEKTEKSPIPRGEYAARSYKVTEAGKAAAPRGNRGLRWELVKGAKSTTDILGKTFTRTDGAEGTITSAGLKNFVERGYIEFTN